MTPNLTWHTPARILTHHLRSSKLGDSLSVFSSSYSLSYNIKTVTLCFGSCPGTVAASLTQGRKQNSFFQLWRAGEPEGEGWHLLKVFLRHDALVGERGHGGARGAKCCDTESGPLQGSPCVLSTVIIVIILRLGLSSLITSYRLRPPLLLH